MAYDYLTDTDLSVLAELAANEVAAWTALAHPLDFDCEHAFGALPELAAEEVAAWAALAHPLDCDYEPADLNDYEVQQFLYQG